MYYCRGPPPLFLLVWQGSTGNSRDSASDGASPDRSHTSSPPADSPSGHVHNVQRQLWRQNRVETKESAGLAQANVVSADSDQSGGGGGAASSVSSDMADSADQGYSCYMCGQRYAEDDFSRKEIQAARRGASAFCLRHTGTCLTGVGLQCNFLLEPLVIQALATTLFFFATDIYPCLSFAAGDQRRYVARLQRIAAQNLDHTGEAAQQTLPERLANDKHIPASLWREPDGIARSGRQGSVWGDCGSNQSGNQGRGLFASVLSKYEDVLGVRREHELEELRLPSYLEHSSSSSSDSEHSGASRHEATESQSSRQQSQLQALSTPHQRKRTMSPSRQDNDEERESGLEVIGENWPTERRRFARPRRTRRIASSSESEVEVDAGTESEQEDTDQRFKRLCRAMTSEPSTPQGVLQHLPSSATRPARRAVLVSSEDEP